VNRDIPEDQRQETRIRAGMFQGEIQFPAQQIITTDVVTSSFGLRVNEFEDRPIRSQNRNQDPDVIAFKVQWYATDKECNFMYLGTGDCCFGQWRC